MEPRKKQRSEQRDETEAPAIQQADWDAIKGGRVLPDKVSDNVDAVVDVEKEGDLPEEDDDNAYQNSDEALPDDEEEGAISRDLARRAGPLTSPDPKGADTDLVGARQPSSGRGRQGNGHSVPPRKSLHFPTPRYCLSFSTLARWAAFEAVISIISTTASGVPGRST